MTRSWRGITLALSATIVTASASGCSADVGVSSDSSPRAVRPMSPTAAPSATEAPPRTIRITRDWVAPTTDFGWIAADGSSGTVRVMPAEENAVDARDGRVLTLSRVSGSADATARTRLISTGESIWQVDLDQAIDAKLRADGIMFASTVGRDGGVWAVAPSDAAPRPVIPAAPRRGGPPDAIDGRGLLHASPSGDTIVSSMIIDLGKTDVDVITERPGLRRFSLPIGMSVDAVGGARLVVRDDDEIVGIDIASGDPVWRLPFRGIHAGSYVTSDDAFYVTSIRAGHATPAPLQLVVVDLRSDEVRVLREWKAGEPAPNFIPELSSDTTAVFLTEAIDIDDYLHLGAGRVDAVAVDLTTGELSSGSFELSVEPAL